jgi:ankyrin repeat protein
VHYAAAFGWPQVLQYLISSASAIPNPFNDWKMTPLAIGMLKGHLQCCEILLSVPGVDVNVKDEQGNSLVVQTIGLDLSEEVVRQLKYLIQQKKCDVTIANDQGWTALHFLVSKWNPATSGMFLEVAEMLISHGAKINALNNSQQTPIQLWNAFTNAGSFLSSLPVLSWFLEVCRCSSFSLLFNSHSFFLLLLLLQNGAQLVDIKKQIWQLFHSNFIDFDLMPLHTILLRYFDDYRDLMTTLDSQGYVPLHHLLMEYNNWSPKNPPYGLHGNELEKYCGPFLEKAAKFLETLIHDLKLDVNVQVEKLEQYRDVDLSIPTFDDEGNPKPPPVPYNADGLYSPLHFAANHQKRFTFLMEVLLKFSPDLNKISFNGQTPLHIAACKSYDFSKLLVGAGANVALCDKNGNTPLHLSIGVEGDRIAELLIGKAADLDIKNNSQETPLMVAARQQSEKLVNLLLAKGANVDVKDKQERNLLHLAVRNLSILKAILPHFLKKKLSIDSPDNKKMTALHYAVRFTTFQIFFFCLISLFLPIKRSFNAI